MPEIRYNHNHILADTEPYSQRGGLEGPVQIGSRLSLGEDIDWLIERSKLPAYIHFVDTPETETYSMELLLTHLDRLTALWECSSMKKDLFTKLRKIALSNNFQITNIIFFGHLHLFSHCNQTMGHIAMVSIAQELSRLYQELGKPLQKPITLLSQNSGYTEVEKIILANLPVPIHVVPNPEELLAINESSLVMAYFARIPLRQILADLVADRPSGKDPAAVFDDLRGWHLNHRAVNIVTYPHLYSFMDGYRCYPISRSFVDMLESYEEVTHRMKVFEDPLTNDRGKIEEIQKQYSCNEKKEKSNGKEDPMHIAVTTPVLRPYRSFFLLLLRRLCQLLYNHEFRKKKKGLNETEEGISEKQEGFNQELEGSNEKGTLTESVQSTKRLLIESQQEGSIELAANAPSELENQKTVHLRTEVEISDKHRDLDAPNGRNDAVPKHKDAVTPEVVDKDKAKRLQDKCGFAWKSGMGVWVRRE